MTRNTHLKSWNDVFEMLVDAKSVPAHRAEAHMFAAYDFGSSTVPGVGQVSYISGTGYVFAPAAEMVVA
jgi:hypothetical protein